MEAGKEARGLKKGEYRSPLSVPFPSRGSWQVAGGKVSLSEGPRSTHYLRHCTRTIL